MKTIEKEINWHIGSVEHKNGHTTFGTKACGKAIIVLPEGFVAPSDYTNCFDNQFCFLTDEKYSDEQILLNYLGSKWEKVIETYFTDHPAKNSLIEINHKVLISSLAKISDTTLSCLNKMAQSQNIGKIKNMTVEYWTDKDKNIETLKDKDKTYKITTEIKTSYELVQNQPENQIKGKSTEEEK